LQDISDEEDFHFVFVPVGEELLELLVELGLQNHLDPNGFIIAPDVSNRKYLEDFSSKSFSFFFKKLKRSYSRQLKHLRKTYITQEDYNLNDRVSLQHSDYKTTTKHYVNKINRTKELVRQGFRVFQKQSIDAPKLY
jgi:hypothetical protein